jgi:membrane fusion protein, multidrug efflux system
MFSRVKQFLPALGANAANAAKRERVSSRWAALAAALACATALTACEAQDKNAGPPAGAAMKTQVSVVSLHPQSVAITAELPGRTTASLEAVVRPQVGGIIKDRTFKEGSEVKQGDALYQIDPAPYQASYDSALADLQKADAAVPSAQSKVDRYKGLIGQNAISKQDLDDADASLKQALAEVASAKAAVETARINLDYTTIRAPISGRIDKSALTPGALVTASQDTALTTIRTLDPINVDVTQSSTNLLNLREAIDAGRIKFSGANIKVSLKLENGSIYPLHGKLEFAESAVSESTGTFVLRAEFPNPERLLLPGMYVRALVEEGVADNSFLVPQRAVSRNTKGEPIAWFITADNKVEQRVLTVGQNVGNNWLVGKGIADGDRVIVEGSQLVRAGQEVQPVEVTIDEATGEVKEVKQSQAQPRAEQDVASNGAASSVMEN